MKKIPIYYFGSAQNSTFTGIQSFSISLESAVANYCSYKADFWSISQKRSAELSFRKLIEYFSSGKLVANIDKLQAQEFMRQVRQTAPRGYTVYYRNYRALFNWLIDMEMHTKNPFAKMRFPYKQQIKIEHPAPAQLVSVIRRIPNKVVGQICEFACNTGLRLSEIINMRVSDFRIEKGIPVVIVGGKHFTTKTRKQRTVPLPAEMVSLLQERIAVCKDSSSYIFAKSNSFPFTAGYVSRQFKKYAVKAGLDPNYHFHSLRAHFASQLAANNTSAFTISRILGHANIKTTEIYMQEDIHSLHTAVSQLNNHQNIGVNYD